MSFIDIILIAVFIFAGFRGYQKGFISQLASLVGLLLGIWGAIKFADLTAELLTEHLHITTEYLHLIAFAITFGVIAIAVYFLGNIVEGLFELAFLGFANSILGVVFGVLKTAFILSVILVIMEKSSPKYNVLPKDIAKKSLFYHPIARLAPSIFPDLNFDELKTKLKETIDPVNPKPKKVE
jgi:membrane protein required for colicin V production